MKFRSTLPAAVLAALSPAGHAQAQESGVGVDGTGATLAPIDLDAPHTRRRVRGGEPVILRCRRGRPGSIDQVRGPAIHFR
ncbi:hypothetical protein CFB46_21505 [Burkholderia sp. HI2761]|uniref:hypothetical protein n=1 Tax=unclassified Burkholderia TaxID=2613784 RepID=UPI000B7A5A78|nr:MULTISPECIES: hypothetical protein [unclassified Burkholderia]MPV60701.1 hypothetical protein [Burkholderia sp. BE24]OXJ23463.1 hypothetical protein CFB46_21505 [Burkholderia sp. HI2761]